MTSLLRSSQPRRALASVAWRTMAAKLPTREGEMDAAAAGPKLLVADRRARSPGASVRNLRSRALHARFSTLNTPGLVGVGTTKPKGRSTLAKVTSRIRCSTPAWSSWMRSTRSMAMEGSAPARGAKKPPQAYAERGAARERAAAAATTKRESARIEGGYSPTRRRGGRASGPFARGGGSRPGSRRRERLPSRRSALISSPRWAGRQWRAMAPGAAWVKASSARVQPLNAASLRACSASWPMLVQTSVLTAMAPAAARERRCAGRRRRLQGGIELGGGGR